MADIRQISQLNGIPALACALVLMFDAGYPGHLLWSGVDRFFVLSGCLIPGIQLSLPKMELPIKQLKDKMTWITPA
ncbi:MAG: hypothetical protein ACRESS_08295 [Stenotrophobium sp.]